MAKIRCQAERREYHQKSLAAPKSEDTLPGHGQDAGPEPLGVVAGVEQKTAANRI